MICDLLSALNQPACDRGPARISSLILKKAVENHFTAKTPRARRTYNKDKSHTFGEDKDHTHSNSNSCFSLASSRLCGGSFIPTAFSRLIELLSPMVFALQLSFHVGTKP